MARRAEEKLQQDLDTAHARVAGNAELEKRCRSTVTAKQAELAELKAESGKIAHEIAKNSAALLARQDEIAKAIAEFEVTAEAANSVVEERNAIVEACEALFGTAGGAGDGGAASAENGPLLNEEEAAERRRCDAEVSARRQKFLTLKEQYDGTQGKSLNPGPRPRMPHPCKTHPPPAAAAAAAAVAADATAPTTGPLDPCFSDRLASAAAQLAIRNAIHRVSQRASSFHSSSFHSTLPFSELLFP